LLFISKFKPLGAQSANSQQYRALGSYVMSGKGQARQDLSEMVPGRVWCDKPWHHTYGVLMSVPVIPLMPISTTAGVCRSSWVVWKTRGKIFFLFISSWQCEWDLVAVRRQTSLAARWAVWLGQCRIWDVLREAFDGEAERPKQVRERSTDTVTRIAGAVIGRNGSTVRK